MCGVYGYRYKEGITWIKIYCKVLAWSIMRLVNRQKNYHDRCDRLNRIVNWLVDVYSDYSKGGQKVC